MTLVGQGKFSSSEDGTGGEPTGLSVEEEEKEEEEHNDYMPFLIDLLKLVLHRRPLYMLLSHF